MVESTGCGGFGQATWVAMGSQETTRSCQPEVEGHPGRTIGMSLSGICQICESRPAQSRCETCGTLACATHYKRQAGVCVQCAQGMQAGDGQDVTRL